MKLLAHSNKTSRFSTAGASYRQKACIRVPLFYECHNLFTVSFSYVVSHLLRFARPAALNLSIRSVHFSIVNINISKSTLLLL